MGEVSRIQREETALPGVVAVLSRPDGYDPIVAVSFDTHGQGASNLRDLQFRRARNAVARKLFETFCGWPIINAFDQFDMLCAMDKLVSAHGWKLTYQYVGHPEEKGNA